MLEMNPQTNFSQSCLVTIIQTLPEKNKSFIMDANPNQFDDYIFQIQDEQFEHQLQKPIRCLEKAKAGIREFQKKLDEISRARFRDTDAVFEPYLEGRRSVIPPSEQHDDGSECSVDKQSDSSTAASLGPSDGPTSPSLGSDN